MVKDGKVYALSGLLSFKQVFLDLVIDRISWHLTSKEIQPMV